jgi:hypothetical protein
VIVSCSLITFTLICKKLSAAPVLIGKNLMDE